MPKFELIQGGKSDTPPALPENDPIAEEREWLQNVKAKLSNEPEHERMAYLAKFMGLSREHRKVLGAFATKQLIDSAVREEKKGS